MKRPLAVLAGAAIAGISALVPLGAAANADAAGSAEIQNVSTSWRDGTLSVTYDWDDIGSTSVSDTWPSSATFETLVDGAVVDTVHADAYASGSEHEVKVTRVRAAGPATVSIAVTSCDLDSTFTAPPCATSSDFTKTVSQVLTPPRGESSALALLGKLPVKAESHAKSYTRSKFTLWVDANGDGENTRAEVLKSESQKKVKENSQHTVMTGKWVSPYDGKTVTVASKLDIDHLVPLEEAWTSGAYGWSVMKREAYANDLGYGASLVAVTQHANRSKGDKEPNAYLPTLTSYRCSYVRDWIAVKYRWALSVNSAERTALTGDLTTYCMSNDWVKTPGKPSISTLVPRPKPRPARQPVSGSETNSGGSSTSGSSSTSAPAGATAVCRDGTNSYSQHRQGTCSHHGGVSVWL